MQLKINEQTTAESEPAEFVTLGPAERTAQRGVIWAGVLLGLGVGGFFDGIVFHQILQWHHMLSSAGLPPDTLHNLELNTLADGLFHAMTYVFTIAGLAVLWRAKPAVPGSGWVLVGAILLGWGVFNVVEGIVNHQLLGIHHVRDDIGPGPAQVAWDMAFLAWGAIMALVGWLIVRSRSQRHVPLSD